MWKKFKEWFSGLDGVLKFGLTALGLGFVLLAIIGIVTGHSLLVLAGAAVTLIFLGAMALIMYPL